MRPDMFSMIAFGAQLLALDAFARGKTRALAFVPLAHLLWVNSHQLWPLSLIIQGLFVADLAWQRDRRRGAAGGAGAGGVGAADVRDAARLRHRARAAAHRAVAVAVPREPGRVPPHLDDVARIDAGAGDRGARRVRAVAHAPQAGAVRSGAVADVAGAGDLGGARPDVLRRRQRRRVPALRRCARTPPATGCCRRSARSHAAFSASPASTVTLVTAGTAVYYRWVRPPFTLGGTQAGPGARLRRLGRGRDRLHPRRPAARPHAEPRDGPGRRRPVLGPRHPGVRRFAAGILPARVPADRASRRRRTTPSWPS